MAKFHIKANGDPGRCSAAPGNCPLSSDDDHYDSQEQAQKASAEKISKEFSTYTTLKKKNPYSSPEEERAVKEIIENYADMIENGIEDLRYIDYIAVSTSADERAALGHYATGFNFNNEAYNIPTFEDEKFDHPEVLAHGRKILDEMFTRLKGKGSPTVSFRGMRQNSWEGDFEKDFVDKLASGEIEFAGYTSTSLDKDDARSFSYDPDGGKTVFLRFYGNGGIEFEHQEIGEYLYGRGTKWKVITWSRDSKGNIEASLKLKDF